jgi:PAS domain S-box-containing protein
MGDPSAPRIGVVDDNPATLYSTARVLRRANFEVSEGVTGAQALALAESADLLLLDVHLPDIHGFEVCKRLRANPRTARLPIIHISATFVTEINKAQGLDAGGDGYLTHPIEPLVLVATVNAFLRARRAEDEMRTNEAKFKAVFDNASSGILLLDCQLTLLEVNPAMCTLLQRQREQIAGKPLSFFVPPEHGLDLVQIARELEAQGTWRGVVSMLRPDGRMVSVECDISAHSFPGVRLAIATDITERLQFERERTALLASERAARAEAEHANRLKDDFLSTLSHELRSPLNSILMWAELLRQQPDNPAQVSRGLAAIERNTRLQANLISELLDVSRIASGKLRLDIQPLDPAMIIKTVLESLTPALQAKAQGLKTSFDPRLGMISADPARLQQVIWNLVNNAIKFTPNGGRIAVSLKRAGKHVQLTVSDTGEGITRELMPHLFERFRQGVAGGTRVGGGLGLGLAIVKHLVEMHGGEVSAASAGVGKGATFTVRLPITTPLIAAGAQDSAPESTLAGIQTASPIRRLEGVRVLIVDDDGDALDAMSQLLANAGAAVSAASDVVGALAAVDSFKPRILVSDIGMPDRSGYDLIGELRSRGYTRQALPAIALTAFAGTKDRRRALLAGYQVHVAKPIDANTLTEAIAKLVGRAGS